MRETEFKYKLRETHVSVIRGAQAIVEVLADHDDTYMSVSLDSIEGAAARLEHGARQLRDLIAVVAAERKTERESDKRLVCAECKELIDPEDETILGEAPFHRDCSQGWCERFAEEIGKVSGTTTPDFAKEFPEVE
jgi:hypothetical protein